MSLIHITSKLYNPIFNFQKQNCIILRIINTNLLFLFNSLATISFLCMIWIENKILFAR